MGMRKDKNGMEKRKYSKVIKGSMGTVMLLYLFLAVFSGIVMPTTIYAAEEDLQVKITKLQEKFPHGKYWNHVGSANDNENGWTDTPCNCHGITAVSHINGTGGCTCNHHTDGGHLRATQCMGFANKLGYDVFGNTKWYVYSNPNKTQLANIKVGDIVRYSSSDTSGHSVFVTAKSGYTITVGEANYGGRCKISWNRVIDLNSSAIHVINYEHAYNYDTVAGTDLTEPNTGGGQEQPSTAVATTENETTEATKPFTGWKKASDDIHYHYYKDNVIQKKKWITISGKKYYLDKNGYRVTGLVKIGNQHYYFNAKGVLQKKKWVSSDGEDYYVANNGAVLKSQWLYKNNVLVYVISDGSVAKDELVEIRGNTYYFNSKGKRSKGFKKCNGKYYYCNSKGIIQKKKWIKKNGKMYYLQSNGVRVQDKLVKIGKYKYYFNVKGCLLKKKNITYKGKIYRADKKGRCKLIGEAATTKTVNP